MNKLLTSSILPLALSACTEPPLQTFATIADAREHPAQFIDIGDPGDSVGDILTFDQPLLDENHNVIGNNSGSCIRTRIDHSFQCQWTLSTQKGSIQVSGREHDKGRSDISITGGTGIYAGIYGEMESINNDDGTFTQVLKYRIRE